MSDIVVDPIVWGVNALLIIGLASVVGAVTVVVIWAFQRKSKD